MLIFHSHYLSEQPKDEASFYEIMGVIVVSENLHFYILTIILLAIAVFSIYRKKANGQQTNSEKKYSVGSRIGAFILYIPYNM